MNTFIAVDGNEYKYDTWYMLPFIFNNKPWVPIISSDLRLLLPSGKIIQWTPFVNSAFAEFWQLKSWDYYSI